MTRPPDAPPNAIAFRRAYVGYDWQLNNGRYQSCPEWRRWLKVFGGEVEFEAVVDVEGEPNEQEFMMMMGW